MAREIVLFPFQKESVENQMALDEAVFLTSIEIASTHPVLRFYEFDRPSATIGFGQRNFDALPINHLPWTRRITGGGFVRHANDLVMSLVSPIEAHADFTAPKPAYLAVHSVLAAAFRKFGTKARFYGGCKEPDYSPEHMMCFERPICDDLILDDTKIAGGAQRRRDGYFLHQESIELRGIEKDAFIREVVREFENWLNVASIQKELSDEVIYQAGGLAQNKYAQNHWKLKGHLSLQTA